jgi:predicted SAM-dependent methyltransferase
MIKLHLGCGWRNFGKEWIHIDGGDYNHLDYNDVTKLPFQDNTVDLIYSSHMIEYIDREEIINILLEWKRVLKPGGILRIAVPDFESMATLYLNKSITLDKILGPLYGKMKMSNDIIYHRTVYDYESLEKLTKGLGFVEFKKYDWKKTDHSNYDDHSQAYIPHMDKENGVLISLNVEMRKYYEN